MIRISTVRPAYALAFAFAAGLAIGGPGSAAAQTKDLRMANWLPPVHHMQKTIPMWAAQIEKASGGSVKINLMKAPLAKAPGQYDLVKKGIADIAFGVAAFTPKRFQLYRAIELPFNLKNATSGSAAMWDWYARTGLAKKEFHDAKLIAAFTHAPFLYHSRKPLNGLGDLKGLKVRAGGTGIEILKRLGAAPVFIPPGGTTEAVQRGTVDATQFPWEGLAGFRLTKLTTHHLVIPNGLYSTAFWVAMSNKAWAGLTPAQQKAFSDNGLSGSKLIGQRWDAVESKAKAAAVANGNKIVVLGDADTAKLRKVTSFFEEGWLKKANAAGLDGKASLADLRKTVKKYE